MIILSGRFIASTISAHPETLGKIVYITSMTQPDAFKPSHLWGLSLDKSHAIKLTAEQANIFKNEMRKAGRICSLEPAS